MGHGVCNAVLLPVVQTYNAKYVPELFIDIAHAMGFTEVGQDSSKAVEVVLQSIRALNKRLGIPPNIKELGAKPEDFEALAENAMKDALPCRVAQCWSRCSRGPQVAWVRLAFLDFTFQGTRCLGGSVGSISCGGLGCWWWRP